MAVLSLLPLVQIRFTKEPLFWQQKKPSGQSIPSESWQTDEQLNYDRPKTKM